MKISPFLHVILSFALSLRARISERVQIFQLLDVCNHDVSLPNPRRDQIRIRGIFKDKLSYQIGGALLFRKMSLKRLPYSIALTMGVNDELRKTKWKRRREGRGQSLNGVQRPLLLREYALREFGEIFVDDRPFCRDACFKHANVQSKAVFSYAMRVMDKICGWEDEEKWVGSKFALCMWMYTQEVLTSRQKPTPEMEEYLKRRLLSIKLCMNCVCAGTFDDHEFVSESTITK